MKPAALATPAVLIVAGLAAGAIAPGLVNKARLAVRKRAGVRFTSGVPSFARATADPALGRPA